MFLKGRDYYPCHLIDATSSLTNSNQLSVLTVLSLMFPHYLKIATVKVNANH